MPRLGSTDNKTIHNLFVTTGRHGAQFNHPARNPLTIERAGIGSALPRQG
jgi:hypothetical protein